MSERKPFSTWHVVLMVMAIIFLVIGIALISYGATQLSLHVNRQKPAYFWWLTVIGIILVILAIIMMLVFWYWHRQNRKHCKSGWITPGGGIRPGCEKEVIEAKHVEVPINISHGPPHTQVIPAHMHPHPAPVTQTYTTTTPVHLPPHVDTVAYTHQPAPYLHGGLVHVPPPHTHLERNLHTPSGHIGLTSRSSVTASSPSIGLDSRK